MVIGLAILLVGAVSVLTIAWWHTPVSQRPEIHPLVKVTLYTLVSLGLVAVVAGFGFALNAVFEFSR